MSRSSFPWRSPTCWTNPVLLNLPRPGPGPESIRSTSIRRADSSTSPTLDQITSRSSRSIKPPAFDPVRPGCRRKAAPLGPGDRGTEQVLENSSRNQRPSDVHDADSKNDHSGAEGQVRREGISKEKMAQRHAEKGDQYRERSDAAGRVAFQ